MSFLKTIFVLVSVCLTSTEYAHSTENSLLWKITTPKGKVHHLLGTIHLPDTTLFTVNKKTKQTFEAAKVFIAEIDLESTPDINPLTMMLPQGKTLKDIYSPADYAIIDSVITDKLGEMASMLMTFKPPYVAAMLMLDELSKIGESNSSVPFDMYLWQSAKEKNKSRGALETIGEQLMAFSAMPDSLLVLMLRDTSSSDTMLDELLTTYKKQNLDKLATLIASQAYMQEFMVTLNDNRNAIMLQRLPKILDGPEAFIAVGAAHLPGKNGLLQGLQRLGYKVQAVK